MYIILGDNIFGSDFSDVISEFKSGAMFCKGVLTQIVWCYRIDEDMNCAFNY